MIIERGIERFVGAYRRFYGSVPPKVHLLEDHTVDQVRFIHLPTLEEMMNEGLTLGLKTTLFFLTHCKFSAATL